MEGRGEAVYREGRCRRWDAGCGWRCDLGEGGMAVGEDLPMACWAFLAAARPERREGILPYTVDR